MGDGDHSLSFVFNQDIQALLDEFFGLAIKG